MGGLGGGGGGGGRCIIELNHLGVLAPTSTCTGCTDESSRPGKWLVVVSGMYFNVCIKKGIQV
jgi:hypothetical protein